MKLILASSYIEKKNSKNSFYTKIKFFRANLYLKIRFSANTCLISTNNVWNKMIWYPLSIIVKKSEKNWKKVKIWWKLKKQERPRVSGTYAQIFIIFETYPLFHENKPAKSLRLDFELFSHFFLLSKLWIENANLDVRLTDVISHTTSIRPPNLFRYAKVSMGHSIYKKTWR